VSRQNKLGSGPFSALFACAMEATVRELRFYMNNKTSGKYHVSVTSSCSKTKDLQKIPLENWVFLHTLFLKNQAQINKNNYATMLFMSKQVSLPKISSILQKTKIGSKCYHTPFLYESLQLLLLVWDMCAAGGINPFTVLCLVIRALSTSGPGVDLLRPDCKHKRSRGHSST